jgi:hypothetical protein
MYQEDNYNPADPNDYDDEFDKMLDKSKKTDKGYNAVYRKVQRKDGLWKNKKIDVYTSSGPGTRIRDAETGEYFPNMVGSKDEDLFFKVALSTGECRSLNGSNTLFYVSPQHYMNHLNTEVPPERIALWEERRSARLIELRASKRQNMVSTTIN